MESQITFVGQSIDPASRTVKIEARLPKKDNDLKANMIGEIVVNDASVENTIVVSRNLLQKTDDGNYLFVAEKEGDKWVARKRMVETGISSDDKIEITKNLNKGEVVVSFGYQDLTEGQAIKF